MMEKLLYISFQLNNESKVENLCRQVTPKLLLYYISQTEDLLLPDVGVKEFTSVVAAAAELHTKL
jgi:hypothetical protein